MALRMDRNSPETCAASCFGHFVTQFQNLNHDVTIPYNQAVATGLHEAFPDMQTIAWGTADRLRVDAQYTLY